jgi:cytochrome P450
MWVILEITRDPSLLQAIREEVAASYVTDSETGIRTIDIEKLVVQPLLQSIFTEALRLHMNFNLMRNVNESITMDGFTLPKGSMLQAPMLVAHYDEAVWGSSEHPASEFWAERHIKYEKETDEASNVTQKRVFAMAGRPSSYFPFGGSSPRNSLFSFPFIPHRL